jgi:Domain of unknown function (DUF4383)
MGERSPAQVYSLVVGFTLLLTGVAGFFYSASFSTGDGTEREALAGILDVNGWHNVFHVLTGALGLLLAGSYGGARAFAIGLGALYLIVAGLGFVVGDGGTILGLIPVNTEDNLFHVLVAFAGLGAGLATPATMPASTAPPAAG